MNFCCTLHLPLLLGKWLWLRSRIMDSIEVYRSAFSLILIFLGIKVHLVPHFLFDVLQDLAINELREGIELLLVK